MCIATAQYFSKVRVKLSWRVQYSRDRKGHVSIYYFVQLHYLYNCGLSNTHHDSLYPALMKFSSKTYPTVVGNRACRLFRLASFPWLTCI